MKSLIWVIAEFSLIFFLLNLPGNNFDQTPGWLNQIGIDKFVHIVLFGSLAFSIFVFFENTNKAYLKTVRAKSIALIICILFGITMEYYQKYFVPTRGFEVKDMLADAVGALLALPFFSKLKNYFTDKGIKNKSIH